jgi:hypothetical protein
MIKSIIIKNIKNKNIDLTNKLKINHSIDINNITNCIITINNKINKIIIKNSNNIIIHIQKMINGFEIDNSDNITIKLLENSIIPHIQLYKSNINIYTHRKDMDNINIIKENSNVDLYII